MQVLGYYLVSVDPHSLLLEMEIQNRSHIDDMSLLLNEESAAA